ncbi:MAG: hypothetical protein WCS42_20075 [Verrucomicrobiota bacterium]
MALLDQTSPPDTEALKLGAQRIRELKTKLNAVLGALFDDAGDFKATVIPGSALAGEISGAKLASLSIPAGKHIAQSIQAADILNAVFGNGLLKVNNADPVTVNVDDQTIHFDASTGKKIEVKDAGITLAKLAPDALLAIQPQVTALLPLTSNVLMSATHGLGAVPRFVRWVLVCTTTEATTGYAKDDELSVFSCGPGGDGNHGFAEGADKTKVFLSFDPSDTTGTDHFHIYAKGNAAFALAGVANWSVKCYYA